MFANIFLSAHKGYRAALMENKSHTKEMNELVQTTLDHQYQMGQLFFLWGYLSSNWEVIQNLYLKRKDFNDKLTDWSTNMIKAIWKFSCTLWKARYDWVHGKTGTKTKSAHRRELVALIRDELQRTASHAEYTTRQLRLNVQRSLGNAKVAELEIWLEMLRNVKGEILNTKQNENIRRTRAQPITIFFQRLEST